MRGMNFSRRSLLRGMGAGSVLLSGLSKTLYAADAARTTRAAFFFYANGSHPDWAPKEAAGTTFTLTPHLTTLDPIKNDVVIVKNMILERASGNSHKSTSFSALGAGGATSFDQTLAAFVKDTTPLASLEVAIGTTGGGGGSIPGLSQLNGSFLPGVRNPVAAYARIADRIMGPVTPTPNQPMPTTPTGADKALLARRSLLDYLRDDVSVFKGRLGGTEKAKMDFYLDSLRTLERDIGGMTPGEIKPTASCSKGSTPDATLMKDAHVNDMPMMNHLFLDIIAMAFACNVTRVASGMWGGGQSDESVNFGGISMGDWHSVSHGDPGGGAGQQMIKLQAWMAGELTYFAQKLKSYQDGGFSLLDNTAVVLSTQNGFSTQVGVGGAKMDHDKHNTPFIVAGSCGGAWKTGQLVDAQMRTHNDLYLSIAKAFGMNVQTVGMASWCKGPILMGG
jgi:hypothetical protein